MYSANENESGAPTDFSSVPLLYACLRPAFCVVAGIFSHFKGAASMQAIANRPCARGWSPSSLWFGCGCSQRVRRIGGRQWWLHEQSFDDPGVMLEAFAKFLTAQFSILVLKKDEFEELIFASIKFSFEVVAPQIRVTWIQNSRKVF